MKKTIFKTLLILTLCFCVAMALPGLSAAAENIGSFTAGEGIGTIQIYNSSLEVTDCVLSSGGLPRGMSATWDAAGVYVSGTPETSGNYSATYTVYTSEGAMDVPISFYVEAAPVPTATPEPTPTPRAAMKITKHPTGEYVEAGGTAKFVARADNADKLVWRLVSPDASNTVQGGEAADFFPGLEVSGLNSETLVLSHIPTSLNGWYVEAQFWSGSNHVESSGAKITIVDENGNAVNATPKPTATAAPTPTPTVTAAPPASGSDLPVDENAEKAVISVQPESIELKPGESYTLSVIASSPNGGSLSYQWYSASADNLNAALPISGATEASYTLTQTDGTAYYWVAVWNAKDGSRSSPVYSDSAEVSIASEEPVVTPTAPPAEITASRSSSNVNFQLVLFSIIGVLALAALIGVVIYLRADSKHKDE